MKCVHLLLLVFFNFGIICYGYNSNRIINGLPAPQDKYQNVIKIFTMFLDFNQHAEESFVEINFCTSTLISKRHILTAAHCVAVAQRFQQSPSNATTVGIFIEHLPIHQKLEEAFNLKNLGFASNVSFHPKWQALFFQDDLAIIELPAEITDIEPVVLAKNYQESANDTAISVGYGDLDPSNNIQKFSDTLMEVIIPIVPKNECLQTQWYNDICAGNFTHRADHGDSGGPLFFNASDGKQYQIGVVSSTGRYEKNVGTWPFDPDFMIYMRISDYCDWIEETTNGEAKCMNIDRSVDTTTTAEEQHAEELRNGNEEMSKNIFVISFIFMCVLNIL